MRLFHEHRIEGADVAVWLGFALGLGIAVHHLFFVATAAIAMTALAVSGFHAIRRHTASHRH